MTTSTKVAVPKGAAWTSVYTAGGTVTIGIQNRSVNASVLIRIDATATANDAIDAAAEQLFPLEFRSIPLANGDKVFARSLASDCDAMVVVR